MELARPVFGRRGGTFLVTLPGPPAQITPLLPTSPCPHCLPRSLVAAHLFPLHIHQPIPLSTITFHPHASIPHNAVCAFWLQSPHSMHDYTLGVLHIRVRRSRRIYRLIKSSRHLPLLAGWAFFIARRYRRPPWLSTRGTGMDPFFIPMSSNPSASLAYTRQPLTHQQ